jgi:hypothetical protein
MLRIVPIKLRQLFPSDDPLAAAMAALCILREDLLLELFGIVEMTWVSLTRTRPEVAAHISGETRCGR